MPPHPHLPTRPTFRQPTNTHNPNHVTVLCKKIYELITGQCFFTVITNQNYRAYCAVPKLYFNVQQKFLILLFCLNEQI